MLGNNFNIFKVYLHKIGPGQTISFIRKIFIRFPLDCNTMLVVTTEQIPTQWEINK